MLLGLEVADYGSPRGCRRNGRCQLKLAIINMLRQAPADDETDTSLIMEAKGWGDDMHADVLKRVLDAIERLLKDGYVVQNFGPDGCLWRMSEFRKVG